MEKFFITTAIDYVNAAPHIGHAYEKILADVLARWHRLKGEQVHFLTGTDENAQKNVQAAKEASMPVKKFIDANATYFTELCKKLDIEYDEFIRTTEPRHVEKAQEIIKKVYEKGDIYKGSYEGLYCEGCEEFKTEKDLVEGNCPDHNKAPIPFQEEAYFFKLSKYKKELIKLLKKGLIVPKARTNEILSRLEEDELKDLCVSRRNVEWGIDIPFDPQFKIYVWFDALVNYITGSGKKEAFWPADVHVIGKGISWFHTVIWPAMLLSAGYELPKHVLVHGYLTVDGKKMSKSLGNVINPLELVKKYPSDTIRYFLLREIPFENDGDFSETILKERHNNELANKLGNLVLRLSTLVDKYGLEKAKTFDSAETLENIEAHMENYHVDKALSSIFGYIDSINEFVQNEKPWETKDATILYAAVNSLKNATILLTPFLPDTCKKIAKTFKFDLTWQSLETPLPNIKPGTIKKADILFKKLE